MGSGTGMKSTLACPAMVFKLTMCAQERRRALKMSSLLADAISGVQFVDGIKKGTRLIMTPFKELDPISSSRVGHWSGRLLLFLIC